MRHTVLILAGVLATSAPAPAQVQLESVERVTFVTQEWEGERDKYGRPRVSDDVLARMKYVSPEEAWGIVGSAWYSNKFGSFRKWRGQIGPAARATRRVSGLLAGLAPRTAVT